MVNRLIIVCAVSLLSCVRVASPRAERDQQVGHASAAGVALDVDDGLAAVRALTDASAHLWSNAPTLSLTIRAPAARDFALRVENVLGDAEVLAGDAAIARAPGTRATELRVTIPASAFTNGAARVVIGAPDRALEAPYRFAMYADVQDAIDRVQELYARMNKVPGVRFALVAGDLTEHGGRDELEHFQRELATLAFPVFATLGNHELGEPDVPYHDYFGRGSSSFEYRGVRFTLLDSASATIDPEVYGWLDDWLARGRDRLHVVSMHIAPIDPVGTRSGSFASRNEANKLLARLARGGVDLTLYGHVHSYYAFSNANIPAHISGGGGGIPERMDGIGRHFVTVDVDPVAQTHAVAVVRVD